MEQNMMVNMLTALSEEMELFAVKKDGHTLVSFRITSLLGMAAINGLTGENMTESGTMDRCMEMEKSHGMMDDATWAVIVMIERKELAPLSGRMVGST